MVLINLVAPAEAGAATGMRARTAPAARASAGATVPE